jgi:hypothetical protein
MDLTGLDAHCGYKGIRKDTSMIGEKSPLHLSSERADVKLIERSRNLSANACSRQPSCDSAMQV